MRELLAIAERLEEGDRTRESVHLEALDALERADPELASQLMELFEERVRAAHWLCRRPGSEESPLQLIANGDRDRVASRLVKVQHGFPA